MHVNKITWQLIIKVISLVSADELTELAAAIRREAETLYTTWLGTSERVREWQHKIATTTKVSLLVILFASVETGMNTPELYVI